MSIVKKNLIHFFRIKFPVKRKNLNTLEIRIFFPTTSCLLCNSNKKFTIINIEASSLLIFLPSPHLVHCNCTLTSSVKNIFFSSLYCDIAKFFIFLSWFWKIFLRAYLTLFATIILQLYNYYSKVKNIFCAEVVYMLMIKYQSISKNSTQTSGKEGT